MPQPDTSAANGHRPACEKMPADVADGNVSRIVAYHAVRLYREPRDLEHIIDLCNEHAVEIATVTGDLNISVGQGRLVARIVGAVSRGKVERKTARQKVANGQRAKAGKARRSRTFRYDGDTVMSEEAEAIVDGCAALLNGVSPWSIAKNWNAAPLRTVKAGTVVQMGRYKGRTIDGTWTGGTVRQVLMTASNAGPAV
jgi:site-specific DNA recombinase